MLKLNDLFEDYDLAYKGFELYDYEKEYTKEVIKYFRISANMIYPFYNQDGLCFLRLSPTDERDINNTKAELELLNYLKEKCFRVCEILKTKDNKEIDTIIYDNREYIVCAFKELKGISLEELFSERIDDDIVVQYGEILGKFHQLMQEYKPTNERYSLDKTLSILEEKIYKYVSDDEIVNSYKKIKSDLLSYQRNKDNYGLIHYDMELDNVLFNKKDGIGVIDFDDSFYGFYYIDVVRCLNQLPKEKHVLFMKGYKEYMPVDEKISLDTINRFISIQEYISIVYALSDDIKETPEWMKEIILHLSMKIIDLKEEICK